MTKSNKGTFWDFEIDKYDPHEDHIKQLKVGDMITWGDGSFFEIEDKKMLDITKQELRKRNQNPNQDLSRKLSNKLE